MAPLAIAAGVVLLAGLAAAGWYASAAAWRRSRRADARTGYDHHDDPRPRRPPTRRPRPANWRCRTPRPRSPGHAPRPRPSGNAHRHQATTAPHRRRPPGVSRSPVADDAGRERSATVATPARVRPVTPPVQSDPGSRPDRRPCDRSVSPPADIPVPTQTRRATDPAADRDAADIGERPFREGSGRSLPRGGLFVAKPAGPPGCWRRAADTGTGSGAGVLEASNPILKESPDGYHHRRNPHPPPAKSEAKTAAARRTRRTGQRDPLAITLLKQDHREVEDWFDEYEQLESDAEKLALFNKIALALKVHTQIEEEILYPEERGEVEDDMLDEAYVEHDGAKKLIAEIEAMKPSDDFYDAKVKVLGEYIKHHVKEEEQPGGLFAQAKKGDEDLDAMGERMKARKDELMAKLSGGGKN